MRALRNPKTLTVDSDDEACRDAFNTTRARAQNLRTTPKLSQACD